MTDQQHADAAKPNPFRDVTRTLPTPMERPTGVTVTGVLAAVGGILGILMGMSTLVNTFVGPQISNAMVQPGPLQGAQVEMNKAMLAITLKYQAANVVLSVTIFAIGSCLLSGGIALLRGKPWGRKLLIKTLLVMMVFECCRLIPYTMMQFEILPVLDQYMRQLAAPPPGGGPAAPEFVGKLAKVMMLVGFAGWVLWAIIKLVLCAVGQRYLRKPHVARFFEHETEQLNETNSAKLEPEGE